MRISDWSSDVCSSDLYPITPRWIYTAVRRSSPFTSTEAARVSALLHVASTAVQARTGVEDDHSAPTGLRIRSEEHTSELQSLMRISYAVFCLKKKKSSTLRTINSVTGLDYSQQSS